MKEREIGHEVKFIKLARAITQINRGYAYVVLLMLEKWIVHR